jgi:DNA-binding transcriptional regulator YhcF (GntR family)
MDVNYKTSIQINVLLAELKRRKTVDKSYSLRKFAEDSGIDASTMNKYFKSKRKLTDEAFNLIIKKLRVDDKILDLYKDSLQNYTLLGEKFHQIKSHWYYHGILEVIKLYDFTPSSGWIAKRLGVSVSVIEEAIQDLIMTGVLEIQGNKFYNLIGNTTFIEDLNMDVIAGRTYQEELIQLALTSIHNHPGDIKDHTSLCVAFDKTLIFEVKQRIDKFKCELDDFIQCNSRQYDDVYSLQINFNSVNIEDSEED